MPDKQFYADIARIQAEKEAKEGKIAQIEQEKGGKKGQGECQASHSGRTH